MKIENAGARLRRYALAAVLVLMAIPAYAAAGEIEKFAGQYLGEGISRTDGILTRRDLEVTIRPKGEGFELKWVSVTYNDGGKLKRKAYTVHFEPSDKPGIYGSAMRTDVFGNRVPLDPLKGEPYLWARIADRTLFVYAMLITDNGGYEIQSYERTLTPGGMDLRYSRVRDGNILRTVQGSLKRAE